MAENFSTVQKNKKMQITVIVPTALCFPLLWNRIFRFWQTTFQIMKKHKTDIHGMVFHAVKFGWMILLFRGKWHRLLPPLPTAAAAAITNKF